MGSTTEDSEILIARARGGDAIAQEAILARHRDRLRRLIALRIDRRVMARIDPSDVIQEAMAAASSRLAAYLRDPPLPLLPWLRQFALERLAKLHRYHLRVGRRSVQRERPIPWSSSDPQATARSHPIAGGTSPIAGAIRDEECDRIRAAMRLLPEADRHLLTLRHIEAFSMARIAATLGISEGAAKVRHLRSLRRLRGILEKPR